MLTQDQLSLRLQRLRENQEWSPNGTGLFFVFPKGGSGSYTCGSASGSVASGDVLVLNGAARSMLKVSEDGQIVFWWFSTCCEHLYPLFASREIHLVHCVIEEMRNARSYLASDPMAVRCHRLLDTVPQETNLDHRSQLLRIVAIILAGDFETARGRRVGYVPTEAHMTQVFEGLSVSDMVHLQVTELARRFGCSRRHLNRLFHRFFGTSVGKLKMEMRLSKAVALLRDPDSKIIRVAEEAGFNHLGLFNICFKRRFGMSPSQWRKGIAPSEKESVSLGSDDPGCPMSHAGLCPWYGKKGVRNTPARERLGPAHSDLASRRNAVLAKTKSGAGQELPPGGELVISQVKARLRAIPPA